MTGQRLKALGTTKCVVVTDATLVMAGIVGPIVDSIKAEGIEVVIYDKVLPDPPDYMCVECGELMKEVGADGIVAIGGGSPMDVAKTASLVAVIPEKITDLYEYSTEGSKMNRSIRRQAAAIYIPTTAGSSAESTLGCVITDTKRSLKMTIFNDSILPDLAIIDPDLTLDLPAWPTATTGVDALAHIVEHLIGFSQLEFMDDILFDCAERVWKWLPVALAEPHNKEARSQMAWAAHHALCNGGFSNTHGLAQAMGGVYYDKHFVHGHACAIMLPAAIRWHAETRAIQIRKLAHIFGLPVADDDSNIVIANRVADAVLKFYKDAGLPTLHEAFEKMGITDDKETFIAKMVPAVKVESLAIRFLPPIHLDDNEIVRLLELVWNDK